MTIFVNYCYNHYIQKITSTESTPDSQYEHMRKEVCLFCALIWLTESMNFLSRYLASQENWRNLIMIRRSNPWLIIFKKNPVIWERSLMSFAGWKCRDSIGKARPYHIVICDGDGLLTMYKRIGFNPGCVYKNWCL